MERICESGRAKAIGVSNFNIHHLEDLLSHCRITPAVNQIEYHPYRNTRALVDFCQAHGIAVQAYTPLGKGIYFDNPVILDIADKHLKSPAQIGLRWAVERGVSVIPKSTNERRIMENINIFDFSLTEAELKRIDAEDRNMKIASIPEDIDPAEIG